MDEAGLFRDDFKVRAAVMFTTVARQDHVTLASTPKGKRGWFYTAWTSEQGWSKHRVSLSECPHISKADLGELRQVMTELEWRQETECEFLDEVNAFITYDTILGCVEDYVPAKPSDGGPVYMGVDFGRYRDSTVIVGVAKTSDGRLRICYLEEMCGQSFEEQLRVIGKAVEALRPQRVAVDSTGMGAPLAETLSKTVPGLMKVTITSNIKTTLVTNLRSNILQRRIVIPADASELINQLRLYQQVTGEGGTVRYGAPPGEHDDYVTALALACYAALTTHQTNIQAIKFWSWTTTYGLHSSAQQGRRTLLSP